MATIAKLDVLLGLEDGAFTRGLENSRKNLDKWGSSLRSAGTKFTAGFTAPIVGGGLMLVKWASDLEQTIGATDHIWGDNAGAMKAWAKTADKSMGMTQEQALQSANRFESMLTYMGYSGDEAVALSQKYTSLSADMGAMFGYDPTQFSGDLQSALMGNYEVLDKYGININDAIVSQKALEMTGKSSTAQLTLAEKQTAALALITEETADVEGQFARELKTTAGQLSVNTARAKNAATAFGKLLLPAVNKLLSGFSKMVSWIENLSDTQRKWVLIIAAVVAAIGPLLLVIGMLLPGIGALIGVIGFLISPIGAVILIVALLVGGLIYAYTHFEGFRNAVNATASVIATVAVAAFEALLRAMEPVIELATTVVGVFTDLKDALMSALSGDWSGAWESLKSAASGALDAIGQYFMLIPNMIMSALNVSNIGELLAKGAAWAQGLWDGAKGLWDTSIAPWFSGLAADALLKIGEVSTSLQQKGTDFIQGIYTAITVGWTTVDAWFVNMKNLAFNAVGETISTLTSRGTNIISGFYEAATLRFVAVRTWFINLPKMIFNAIGSLAKTLWSRGTEALTGFYMSVIDKWSIGGVRNWFATLGTKIAGAVPYLGESLIGAGRAVMSGLRRGLEAGWNEITGWLSGLNPADWKGPEARDKKMLYMPGLWIMEGLGRGLDSGWGDVTRQLSGYVPSIDASALPGASTPSLAGLRATGTTVIDNSQVHYVALNDAQFAELLAAKDKANITYDAMTNRNSASQYRKAGV